MQIPDPGTYQNLGFPLLGDPPTTALVSKIELVTVKFKYSGISLTGKGQLHPQEADRQTENGLTVPAMTVFPDLGCTLHRPDRGYSQYLLIEVVAE